jgi:hypothetical protein
MLDVKASRYDERGHLISSAIVSGPYVEKLDADRQAAALAAASPDQQYEVVEHMECPRCAGDEGVRHTC